ncbi:hypothetical protein PRIPAC_78862 [Pristionchus pacificus]|uniref:G protein-coupled receptor n=1 Tax=Pristionchus pacificus TaxID=54126 RepID=A0A2A6CKY8_PRIPA|nr:hypothetical protein PRIPAC_78862 [Pristionchus pacificus]|eukprot:PDM78758.1 G protein-coupled receptor [Pristionchus pacificus]
MVSEKNRALFEFFAVFEIVNIASSIVTNLLLVYLILHRSSREIGAYRYLLLAFAINDIWFPIVHFLTLPVICTYKDAFVMFSHGILSSRFSISLFGTTFSQTMPLLAHLFIYRLIATKWPRHLQFYSARSCILLVTITLGVEFTLWFLNSYYGYGSDLESRDYVQPFLDEEFEGDGKEFIGALYYNSEGNIRMKALLATMGFNAMMAFFMAIIVFCCCSIVLYFRSVNLERSDATKKLQKQLFYILVVQMIFPMLFVCFPCAGVINFPLLGLPISLFPNLVSASLTIFPLMDALIIMLGVKSYRHTLFHFFKYRSTMAVIGVSNSHSHTIKVGTSMTSSSRL